MQMKGQGLHLSFKTEKEMTQGFRDSLQIETLFKDYISLEREVDTIQMRLQHLGYIESELKEFLKESDSSYVANFFLGEKYEYIKVYYSENDFSEKELQTVAETISENYFILRFETIPIAMRKLTDLKTTSGNAFAKLNLSTISKGPDNQLSAYLQLESGFVRTIDSLVIKGYEKFPFSFLKYYAGIKKGKPFNQKKLVEQNEIVNSLGFVSTIKPPEALFRKEKTTVYFYLEKQSDNLFDGILGFATNEDKQKLEFNGYLNLELNNNLNFGEQLLLNYKADGEEQVNFRVKTNLPYLFKSPFGVGLELKIFKRDSTFITTEQQARITYQIDPRSNSYIGYKGYESSNLLNEVVAGAPLEDFISRFLIAGAAYNRPQNKKLFPIKTFISLDTEVGTREIKSTKEPQTRILATLYNIFNLNMKNSFYVQNSTSVLFSDTYLVNELFRFGGINSIRGFNENSIDASLFSVLNTEYRYQFNEGVYLHSIIDVAYFENATLSLKQNLYGFGIGLGLETKAGILKFNIANGNLENQNFNFSNTKIHLSLSSRF